MSTPIPSGRPSRRAVLLSTGALLRAPRLRAETPATLDELWQDFDPKRLPLEAEIAQEWKLDACTIRTVFYTSEVSQGFMVRVAAYFGRSEEHTSELQS